MIRTDIARQLRWLMVLRVVTVTTLLISAFAIELLLMPGESLRPLFLLAASAYGMVIVYAGLGRWLGSRVGLVYVQLIGDALVVTGFVGITGGIDSAMSFLYLLPICVASMLLYRRGGVAIAAVCWTLYTAVIIVAPLLLESGTPLHVGIEREPGRVLYSLIMHLVGMLVVAVLSSHLSERLRAQGRELAERRGALARLQALNKNIIESINSGLMTTDLDGRVSFVNRGGCEILGVAPDGPVGRSASELLGGDPDWPDSVREQVAARKRVRFERYLGTSDGRTIFLGVAVSSLYDSDGRPIGYIFVFQDLTEIHALEQEVRLKERMAALGEMAAGMAHELRNPLAAISGSVQYLRSRLEGDGETLELMDIILRESQRLDQTIRDFLTFARPGGFEPTRADLVRLLEDSLKLLRKSPEFRPEHRIETRFVEPSVWCELDQNRMRQVFWNLASNALKAMPGGGTLRIEVDHGPGREDVEVRFSDDGRGMNDGEQQRYFQPFSGSFERGTGLGAAIVYRLVEEHGGRISLTSTPGDGTCVRVVIPRRSGVATAPRMAAAAAGG